MPLYEYECDACHGRFEIIRKLSDPPLEICPKCGGTIRKLQSAPAFQFKGSGWYITDYARKDSGGGDAKTGESKGDAAASEGAGKAEKKEKSADASKTTSSSSDSSSTPSTKS